MSINASGSKLARLTKDLASTWAHTKESWRDAKSMEFERAYMEPLVDSVQSAGAVLAELDKVIRKARRDCE